MDMNVLKWRTLCIRMLAMAAMACSFLPCFGEGEPDAKKDRKERWREFGSSLIEAGLKTAQEQRKNPEQAPIQSISASLGVEEALEKRKAQMMEELSSFLNRMTAELTQTAVRNLNRDGELKANLQQGMDSLRRLCWSLSVFLVVGTVALSVWVVRMRRESKALRKLIVKLLPPEERVNSPLADPVKKEK
ncbi:Hypothetical protein PYTT_2245 [Akkermansia glycaniphila]|uniref:Uncharacterized protein n=3 Tax=Akkermansia glycaniphila TaxID=1679444 RepID=A0A1H6M8W4_9BACT|nr:Hypothetical protein PYTT_2245 [Akkermansia glycaniphila]